MFLTWVGEEFSSFLPCLEWLPLRFILSVELLQVHTLDPFPELPEDLLHFLFTGVILKFMLIALLFSRHLFLLCSFLRWFGLHLHLFLLNSSGLLFLLREMRLVEQN
jgi:hypothetical protein